MLRPVAILTASAKIWSRTMFLLLERYDTNCSPFHLGSGKAHSCPDPVTIVCLLLEQRGEWGLKTCMLQLDLARAYDAVRHTAILKSMVKRGVPYPLALAYIREGMRAQMALSHEDCITEPIRAGVGLRQSCRASPTCFQRVFQDTLTSRKLGPERVRISHGCRNHHTPCMGRRCVGGSHDTRSLESMLTHLSRTAEQETGLDIILGEVQLGDRWRAGARRE